MSAPTCILHIGAPKCGSSSLQTALSQSPDLRAANGLSYRYTANLSGRVVHGRALRFAARVSPYSYSSWPNHSLTHPSEELWSALRQVRSTGRRQGHIPIYSCEGWIDHAAGFGANFLTPDEGEAEVVAFLRPPLEWLNAAYWQWGVWGGMPFNTWLSRPKARYQLGSQIKEWSQQPGSQPI